MWNPNVNLWRKGLVSLALLAAGTLTVLGEQKAAGPGTKPAKRADVGKHVAERPAREIVAKAGAMTPTEAMINAPLKLAAAKGPGPSAVSSENPKVQPGLVRWHADFNAARAASLKSGKPVLLFHMMGRLDDLFC